MKGQNQEKAVQIKILNLRLEDALNQLVEYGYPNSKFTRPGNADSKTN
jgi:hypothetical protein